MMTITGDLNILISRVSLSSFSRNIYICVYSSKYSNFWALGFSLFVCMCTRFVCIITCPVLVLCHCNADPLIHLLMISSTSFCGSGLNCQWMHGMMVYIPSARIQGYGLSPLQSLCVFTQFTVYCAYVKCLLLPR